MSTHASQTSWRANLWAQKRLVIYRVPSRIGFNCGANPVRPRANGKFLTNPIFCFHGARQRQGSPFWKRPAPPLKCERGPHLISGAKPKDATAQNSTAQLARGFIQTPNNWRLVFGRKVPRHDNGQIAIAGLLRAAICCGQIAKTLAGKHKTYAKLNDVKENYENTFVMSGRSFPREL